MIVHTAERGGGLWNDAEREMQRQSIQTLLSICIRINSVSKTFRYVLICHLSSLDSYSKNVPNFFLKKSHEFLIH